MFCRSAFARLYFQPKARNYLCNKVTMIMESVEWVSFVLIIFKVVSLAAFGGVDTGNLFQLVLIQQNGRFLLKLLNNCLFPSNYSNSKRHKSWIFYTLPLPLLEKYSKYRQFLSGADSQQIDIIHFFSFWDDHIRY